MPAPSSDKLDGLLTARLQLRPDIRCVLQESGGRPYYQIEDPLNSKFYRLGMREWMLARQMDGQRSLAELIAAQPDSGGLTDEEVVAMGRWLVQSQLATTGEDNHPMFARAPRRNTMPAWLNPAFLRIPLGNPDGLLDRALPWFRWSLSPLAAVVWCVVVVGAIYEIMMHWRQFAQPMSTILAPDNWLYLLGVWVGLKVVHEFYHGLVCKQYGGRVPSCGIMLILFSPVAYVDVTSSWKFRSKWQRILTAAAGMYVELFIAAIATYLWVATDQPLLSQMCHNVIMTASVSTLLFNGNFLMRFDGYYILSDLLGLQNLYGGGQQYVRYLTRRYLLAVSAQPPTGTIVNRWAVRLYGPASLLWRISFYIGILFTAATLFRGAGVILSAMIAVLWMLIPTVRFLTYLVKGQGQEQPDRVRFAAFAGSFSVICAGIFVMPWPGGIIASGVVDYDPLAIVRTETPGFITSLDVQPGQVVGQGQQLATIRNDQAVFDLTTIELSIEQSQLKQDQLLEEGELDQLRQEAEHMQGLQERRDELAAMVRSLQVMAPTEGRVIARDLDSMDGQYLAAGETLLAIGREDQKSILVSVAQKDANFFRRQLGIQPRVRIKGRLRSIQLAKLTKFNPRATKSLWHPALAATSGGPLAVVPRGSEHEESMSPDDQQFELVEPHFTATVALTPQDSVRLRAGEIARVRVGAVGETIGEHLFSAVSRWVRTQLGASW